jgi:hypothetical protein
VCEDGCCLVASLCRLCWHAVLTCCANMLRCPAVCVVPCSFGVVLWELLTWQVRECWGVVCGLFSTPQPSTLTQLDLNPKIS